MKLILKFMKPYRKLFIITVLLIILDIVGALYIPTLIADMMNEGVTAGTSLNDLYMTGFKIIIASIVSGIGAILGGYTTAVLSSKVCKDIRDAVYEKSLKLSIFDFKQFGTASITTRTTSDITNIQTAITMFIQMVLPVPIIFIVAIILTFNLDKLIGFILLGVLIVVILVALFIMKSASPVFKKLQKLLDKMSSILLENITGVRVIRAFNKQKDEENRLDESFSNYANTSIKANRMFANLDGLSFLAVNLFVVIVYWISGGQIADGYFQIGETTAIIGGTGSGKSTIASLILRFHDVTQGSLLLNSQDIKLMTQKNLRDKISYVQQKAWLFSGTIAENLRYGKPNASDKELEHALKVAQASDFVNALPDGINSYVAQGGTNFSGGQRQRLSIARALVKKPEIYIFDDSFSALDFKTDAALRKALEKETKNVAVLIIAQRVSTIRHANQIVVLNEGRIAGKETHEELLENCEVYREIVNSQTKEDDE